MCVLRMTLTFDQTLAHVKEKQQFVEIQNKGLKTEVCVLFNPLFFFSSLCLYNKLTDF